MKISDKVMKVALAQVNRNNTDYEHVLHVAMRVAKVSISAYLKDIWKPFDKDDESTWPKSAFAPSGNKWLCMSKSGIIFSTPDNVVPCWFTLFDVTHYLDPDDIMIGEE